MMMGVNAEARRRARRRTLIPLERYGVKLMSIGFLIEKDGAGHLARADGARGRCNQFLDDVDWGELDYLVIDLPPGTGDAQLTLTQNVPLSGARDRHDAAGRRARSTRRKRHGDVPARCACRSSASSRT